MKVKELLLAKCIKVIDPLNDENTGLDIDAYYVVNEIHIGQSSSSVRIDGIYYNSILFEYYDNKLNEIDIYHSKYSPYFREEDIEEKMKKYKCTYNKETKEYEFELKEIEFEDIDELTDGDIYFYPECSDDSKENFKNKINELIRNQKKIIDELKKGK